MAISANCDLACHTGRYFAVGQGASYRTVSHFSSVATTSLISQSLSVTPAAIAGVTFSVLWMRTKLIVIHHVQRDGVRVVLDLLRECVCQPSEAAHVHSHCEIAALGK